jgi:TrmH family RNA methyltransferase
VLDGVQDPGNVGTILRTADAFSLDGLFLVNACADLYSPKTVRASMGAVFRCPVWSCGAEELGGLLAQSGIPLYGAALRCDTEDVRSVDFSRAAVAIGSEGQGLSRELLSLCSRTVRIPMNSRCESLNAAAAAAVILWEMARNR